MKNNKGFGKFEIMTMIVVLLVVFAFLFYLIIQGGNKQKFSTMKDNALTFAKAVTLNTASFHYSDVVYLEELVDQELSKNIHNPFGGGNCDVTQSRVDTKDGKAYATLRCGKYLIEEDDMADLEKVKIYEVSDWQEKKLEGDDVQERTLFNCVQDGKNVFDQYYEELYFVYRHNKEYGGNAYFADQISNSPCEIVSKTFYRTRKEVS